MSNTAASTFLATPELLELLLLHLPIKTLLQVHAVCKAWKLAIDTSCRVQQALFLKAIVYRKESSKAAAPAAKGDARDSGTDAPTPACPVYMNPLFNDLASMRFPSNVASTNATSSEDAETTTIANKAFAMKLLHGEHRIRDMLITQPAVHHFRIITVDLEELPDDPLPFNITNTAGITFGDIFGAVMEERRIWDGLPDWSFMHDADFVREARAHAGGAIVELSDSSQLEQLHDMMKPLDKTSA